VLVGYGLLHFNDAPVEMVYYGYHHVDKRQFMIIALGGALLGFATTLRKR